MNWLLTLAFVLVCLPLLAATTMVDTVSLPLEKAFSNACVAAASGDTLTITNGSFGWTNNYTMPVKKLNVRGAGTNSETIIRFYAPSTATIMLTPVSQTVANFQDISQITFDGNQDVHQNGILLIAGCSNGPASFRLHHCVFTNADISGSRAVYVVYNGLIDHCTFANVYSGISVFGGGAESWTNWPTVIGSETNLFIEDCRFLFADVGNGPQDAYDGACWVFRYNYCAETVGGGHGRDSGSYTSIKNYEFYENTWTNTGAALANPLQFRGGTGVIWNETFNGYNQSVKLDNYRSCIADHTSTGWGPCSGTNALDGNTAGGFGYPCREQIGRTTNQELLPLSMWNCTLNGSAAGINIPSYTCTTNDPPADGPGLGPHIIAGRDATNLVSAPAWYTPYTYPHPLNVAESVAQTPAMTIGSGLTLGNGITLR